MRHYLRSRPTELHLALMLALTFSTGVIDAVGYLGLDKVFTGNMTGNVVILGMAIAGAEGLPIVGPIIALLAFMVGAAISGRTLRKRPAGWSERNTVLFGIVGVILLAAALTTLLVTDRPEWVNLTITGTLGLAMGVQAGAARHIGVADVTTVVVTSTIVGLAFDSSLGGGGNTRWIRRALAIALIGVGAGVGALLVHVHLGAGMLLAAVITIVASVLGHIGRPGPADA
jgi:uncharacterized membrane protein YoaK (UPF0700 family)